MKKKKKKKKKKQEEEKKKKLGRQKLERSKKKIGSKLNIQRFICGGVYVPCIYSHLR